MLFQCCNVTFYVTSQLEVEKTIFIVFVVEQHLTHITQCVVVVAQFVFEGYALFGAGVDTLDGHVAQTIANRTQQCDDHIVQQCMSLHKIVDVAGGGSETGNLLAKLVDWRDPVGIVVFQSQQPFIHLAL